MSTPIITPFQQIRIVLVETSHTGNMGSVARAMKTMGLSNLTLVNPIVKPDSQSTALAAGASDIIHRAKIVSSFDEAIADCQLVVGTSARSRTLPWPMLTARECGEKVVQEASVPNQKVALVFGRERVGLTNDELKKCHYHVMIPANPDYSSLNLAMAVQILSYEIRMAALAQMQTAAPIEEEPEIAYPPMVEIERVYQHFEQVLLETGFIKANHPGVVMDRLRRLFTRARLEQQEVNILRGILTSIQQPKQR